MNGDVSRAVEDFVHGVHDECAIFCVILGTERNYSDDTGRDSLPEAFAWKMAGYRRLQCLAAFNIHMGQNATQK